MMLSVQTQARLAAELARHGLRATRQRITLLDLLRRSKTHPTVIELHTRMLKDSPNVSRKTVYEILGSFVQTGLASCVTDGGEPYRYEPNPDPHYHARCRVCGRLYDLPAKATRHIQSLTPLPKGFALEDISVTFRGQCARCHNAR